MTIYSSELSESIAWVVIYFLIAIETIVVALLVPAIIHCLRQPPDMTGRLT